MWITRPIFWFEHSGVRDQDFCFRVSQRPPKESKVPALSFKKMDVYALLELRKEVERTLTDRGRDLQRQIALLAACRTWA